MYMHVQSVYHVWSCVAVSERKLLPSALSCLHCNMYSVSSSSDISAPNDVWNDHSAIALQVFGESDDEDMASSTHSGDKDRSQLLEDPPDGQ